LDGSDEVSTGVNKILTRFVTAALQLAPDDRVLAIGTGAGYALAVLSCLAKKVYAVEPFEKLITRAHHHLRRLGYTHMRIRQAHGTLGGPEHAPCQGIVVTANAPAIPETLLAQMAIGGRLVMPVGAAPQRQPLIRVTRESVTTFRREDVGWVCCEPLSGAHEEAKRHHGRGGQRTSVPLVVAWAT
jgi:protein-L-isoaspartate(D-aspartate) O-methyltransferase